MLKSVVLVELSIHVSITEVPEIEAARPEGADGGGFGFTMLTSTVSVALRPPLSVTLAVIVRLPSSLRQLNVLVMLPPVAVAGVPGPDHWMLAVSGPLSGSDAVAAKATGTPQLNCWPSVAGVPIVTVGGWFTVTPVPLSTVRFASIRP